MRESRFLCLAVSRRDGGNCIAGIDLDSGEWIRPVNSNSTGAFCDHELIVVEKSTGRRRLLAPLDVFLLKLEKYAGANAQPENWEITPPSYENPITVLMRFDPKNHLDNLSSYLDKTDKLLCSSGDSVSESNVKLRPLSHSLSLIRPRDLNWKVVESRYPGRFQVRADFRYAISPYSLVVTDPIWEAKTRPLGLGRHAHTKITNQPVDLVFLTISLAAVPLHGRHYKLVAGVIDLSSGHETISP
jgi:hypothetical protein